jgi:shikimate kinase
MDQCIPERASARSTPFAIALVGFMGAGKSTVGKEIALRLGWRFLDLDQFIESRERKTIEQIFREHGEPAFRRLECAAVRDVINATDSTPVVLALGGGAFIEPENQQCLRQAEVPSAFLDAPVAELFRRCEQPGGERPLRKDPDRFRELYEQRRPQYLKAQICVDTSGKPVSDVAREIISGLKLVPVSGACD